MKLSNQQLKDVYYGAYRIEETEEGYLKSYQYTHDQMNYFKGLSDFWFDRCDASNGKTLEFSTTSSYFSFEYKVAWIGSEDTIEMAVDGLIHKVIYLKDIQSEGELKFDLPQDSHHITIYLPSDATILIRNAHCNAPLYPIKKNAQVLWMGDSITQGYGPFRSAHMYVSVANRTLNYNVINQGIGGYVYDPHIIMPMSGYTPDKIIVSLGTNQYESDDFKSIELFYQRLYEIYHDTPVLCITPIWRGDAPHAFEVLSEFTHKLKQIVSVYPHVFVIEGFKLVPHSSEYFIDDLHPNALGSEIYGRNLASAIQKIGF